MRVTSPEVARHKINHSKESDMLRNNNGYPIVLGCNYHTTWQRYKSMRFVLKSVNMDNNTAVMITRRTKKEFATNINDLVFIDSVTNQDKADRLLNFDEDGRYLKALLIQG